MNEIYLSANITKRNVTKIHISRIVVILFFEPRELRTHKWITMLVSTNELRN